MVERVVDTGRNKSTIVVCRDEPGAGGACHEYYIGRIEDDSSPTGEFGHALFQKGPIKEDGVNGCHNEDLIAIVIDRLKGFQSGSFACTQNDEALKNLKAALAWLNQRTEERVRRGVEGTNEL